MSQAAAILLAALAICTTLSSAHQCIHDEIMHEMHPYPSGQETHLIPAQNTASGEPVPLGVYNVNDRNNADYKPLRITVFTFDLDDKTKFCTKAGEDRPNFKGTMVKCTQEDVLTDKKKKILLKEMIPAAIKLHTERLLVKPMTGFYKQTTWETSICRDFTVPETHRQTGVTGADFYLYLAAGPTKAATNAWAGGCARLSDGRPVSGVMNINPAKIVNSRMKVRVLAHEMLHALGFNVLRFMDSKMIMRADIPIRGKKDVKYIKAPRVLARMREHYGCRSAPGMEVEDQGGQTQILSHWKRRNAKDELMAGMESEGYYTAITIAAMEDLGYYKGNYEKAEHMPWGYKAGCKLLSKKCVDDGISQDPMMFCTSRDENANFCTSDRKGLGSCLTANLGTLDEHFKYFPSGFFGSIEAAMMDYCPYVADKVGYYCSDSKEKVLPGSIISATSRCFASEDGLEVKDAPKTIHGICVEVKCNTAAQTYTVKVLGSSTAVPCIPRQTITPSTSSKKKFISGTITCPPYEELCREFNPLAAVKEENNSSGLIQPTIAAVSSTLIFLLSTLLN